MAGYTHNTAMSCCMNSVNQFLYDLANENHMNLVVALLQSLWLTLMLCSLVLVAARGVHLDPIELRTM